MLRSLVSTKPSQSQKREEKKAIKGFMKLLDSKMEQNIQVSPTPGHNSYHKKRDSHDFEDDTELKPTVHPKKLDALDSLEERKRALLYFDKEAERRRIENLDRLRQQNEMNKMKMQEKEQKTRRPGNSAEFLGKRDPLEDQYTLKKPSGYNPLAPISSKPELKSKTKPLLDTNDPANDPRFMFTLDEVGRSEKTNKKIPTTKSYNPLSTQRPVDSSLSGYNPLARPEAHPPKRREPEMSHEQLEMLRRNRENHYGKMDPMDRPIARKPPIEKPREQPFRPPPPRIQQDQRPPSKPLPLPRSVPPSYNPLAASKMPQKPQRLPENYNPVRQPVAPVQRPANPEVDLVRGLANLRNTVPEYESRREHQHNPTIQRAQNVQNAPPAPKQRRINPKDDPNNAYCFRCQEWHRKDLHLGPTPQIQSRKPATHSGMVQSRSSQLSDRQLASQKADLAKAIFEMPPEIKKKPRKEVNLHPRFAFEEEDDFDYDDDFLASDDDEGMNYKKYLRKVTRYNPEAYDDADFDDRDMEVRDFEEIEREDRRSRAIGTKTFTQETMKTILRRWRNRMNALERIIDRENS